MLRLQLLPLIFLAALVLLPFFWWIATYNGLIGRRNQMRNALSSIDVQLKKRHDLIPNVVASVKGAMQHESQLLADLTKLRNEATQQPTESSKRFRAEGKLSARLQEVQMRAEAYPELQASENFLHLQRLLTEVEEQISASRRAYNSSVMELNNGIDMFPSNLVARHMNLPRASPFEISEGEAINPEAKFS